MELFNLMAKDHLGMPKLPEVVPTAEEVFSSLSFDDMWPEAKMAEVCHYLRSGKYPPYPINFFGIVT